MQNRMICIDSRKHIVTLSKTNIRQGDCETWTAPSFLEAVTSGKVGTHDITETAPR